MFETATSLAAAIREGQIGCREALDHFIRREEALKGQLNAVVTVNLEAARRRAEQADQALAQGENWGPLHGLPCTIKDSFEVAGMPTVCGDKSLRGHRPAENALAIQKLIDAGAIVYGKTNVPRLAQDIQTFNSVFGTTNNPWNCAHTPGGSSGGAAASVAAGLTAFEFGSDIGGSIRTPAHWCGVYGHKPSYGVVSLRGHIPGPPGTLSRADLAVAGPLARSAEDLALLLDIAAGPDAQDQRAWHLQLPRARHTRLTDFRVACHLDDPFCPVDHETSGLLRQTADTLEKLGVQIQRQPELPQSLADSFALYEQLLNAVVGTGIPDKLYKRARLGERIMRWTGRGRSDMGRFLSAATQSHKHWAGLNEKRHKLRAGWARFFEQYDVLITPVTPTAAIPHTQNGTIFDRKYKVDDIERPYREQFIWIGPATSALLPATVAPIGRTLAGLPVGLQIIGPYLEDHSSIAFARLLGEHIGGFSAPPSSAWESPNDY